MLRKDATVMMVAHSQYRGVYVGVAQRLKDELGAAIHLYVATPQESAHYERSNPGLFATITVASALYAACREPVVDAAAVIAESQRHEAELGVTINQLSVSDRHLGRGFALGGFKHPRSRISEDTSYVQMLNGFNRVIAFWRAEFDAKQPHLLLNGGKVGNVIARSRGVPTRTLAGSRHKNLHQWVHNEYFENPAVAEAIKSIARAPDAELSAPYDSHMALRKQFVKDVALAGVTRRCCTILLRHVYWRLRGYAKAKGYYPFEEVGYIRRRRRDMLRLQRLSRPLSALERQRFVYYPLHTEPETALHTLSPEYFYQLSSIAALARDLPAGVKLAVKETYEAIGRRPTDFYRQIAEFKNVVILDMLELGLEVARKADAVVTITGTGGFEGAVLGKPVIAFGRHNQYNILDHVFTVTDETRLKDYLRQALDPAFDRAKARRDGARYLNATRSISFDLQNFHHAAVDSVEAAAIKTAYDALVSGLDDTGGGQIPAAAKKAAAL
jgi:hypothetical protein